MLTDRLVDSTNPLKPSPFSFIIQVSFACFPIKSTEHLETEKCLKNALLYNRSDCLLGGKLRIFALYFNFIRANKEF